MTYSSFRSIAVCVLGAAGLSLAISGCGVSGSLTTAISNADPEVWVAESGASDSFGVNDTPASPFSLAAGAGATSMVFFQQDTSQLPLEAGQPDTMDCDCRGLFYVAGGALNVAYNNDTGTTGVPDRDAPRFQGVVVTKTIALTGKPSLTYVGSDGVAGTPLFASSPADHTIRVVDAVALAESSVFKGSIPVTVASVGASCTAFAPGPLGIGYGSQDSLTDGNGQFYLLATPQGGTSQHVLTTYVTGIGSAPCNFLDLGDVGADANSISAEGGFSAVTAPAQNKLYVFGGTIPQTVSVNSPQAVAVLGNTAWVTQNAGASSAKVPLPNTGILAFGAQDCNYSVVGDTTGEPKNGVPDCSFIVSSQPSTWVTIPGGGWIGPANDQATATRSGVKGGSDIYELDFTLTSLPGSLVFSIAADDYVDVSLNNASVFTHSSTDMSRAITRFTVSSGFKVGSNVMLFNVSNASGGPTGLDVAVSSPTAGNLVPVDLTALTVGTPIPVGSCPTVIQAYRPSTYAVGSAAPAGTLLYVGNTCDGTLSVVDPVAKKVVQTIKLTNAASAIATESAGSR